MTGYVSDWLSRITIPDVYPRHQDPFSPGPAVPPTSAPPAAPPPQTIGPTDIYSGWITLPSRRPYSYQRALNMQVTVPATPAPPVPVLNSNFMCETMMFSIPSSGANSVFFGYGNSVNTASGREIRPGSPVSFSVDNTREFWELQRMLEAMAAMIAAQSGWQPPGTFLAPRVVFNAAEYFLTASVQTTLAVMLFYTPELQ
jgi:hypothetical protein